MTEKQKADREIVLWMLAELRRLRRVVRAAVAQQIAREAWRKGGKWEAVAKASKSFDRAVAAYRKGKAKRS